LRGASFNGAKPARGKLGLVRPGHPSPCDLIRGRLTPTDGRGAEDRMEVGSENTWKKEWNFCR